MIQVVNIEISPAKPEDLKTKTGQLAEGKPIIILDETRKHIVAYQNLTYDLDLFIIKELLDAGRICVPIEDHSLINFLKEEV